MARTKQTVRKSTSDQSAPRKQLPPRTTANVDSIASFKAFKIKMEPFMKNVKKIALNQLRLFKNLDTNKQITDDDVSDYVSYIIYHHNNLQTSNNKQRIKPSLKIQLLWMVHALHPKQYFADNHNAFGKVIPVELATDILDCNSNTFREEINKNMTIKKEKVFIQKLDIKQAVVRQYKFINKMNDISKLKEITESEIEAAMERYYKFLYLMKLDGSNKDKDEDDDIKKLNVPTLDIDLIWHSHQFDAEQYHKMSNFIFPNVSVIDHDDNIPDDKLKKYKQDTESRWNKIFGDNDYLNGRVFSRKFGREIDDENKTKKSRKRKLESLELNDENERENKRQRLSNKNVNDNVNEMDYNALKKQLNKEIEARKKLEKKIKKYEQKIECLEENVGELEGRLEHCECQDAGCGGCG